MNRKELSQAIAEAHDISLTQANAIIGTVTDSIIKSVQKGDPVTLVGFGTFKVVSRAARTGRNPATGETLKIAASKLPKFTPGAQFKEAVNSKKSAAKRR